MVNCLPSRRSRRGRSSAWTHVRGDTFRNQDPRPGSRVRLIPGQFVEPFVKTNKNDFNDAETIAETVDHTFPALIGAKRVNLCMNGLLLNYTLPKSVDLPTPNFSRPGLLGAQKLVNRLGFQLVYARVSGIPDAELYRPMFQPWRSGKWSAKLSLGENPAAITPEARYYFYSLATEAKLCSTGSAAECGVYRGGTARYSLDIFPDRERLLFDTFPGMPETDPNKDSDRKGDFADTNLESVKSYVGSQDNIRFVPGLIPETLVHFRTEHSALFTLTSTYTPRFDQP